MTSPDLALSILSKRAASARSGHWLMVRRQLQPASRALYGGGLSVDHGRISFMRYKKPADWQTVYVGKYRKASMTDSRTDLQNNPSIAAILVAKRRHIINFLYLRGAGELAEDIYQDLWARLAHKDDPSISDPLSYVLRAANNLMLDRYRSNRQRELRDAAWGETRSVVEASAENRLAAVQQLKLLNEAIDAVGQRPAQIFRRYRVDAIPQKEISEELGISISTVEADLRKVYTAIAALRKQLDAQ